MRYLIRRSRKDEGAVWKGLVAGLAGGLAASFVMTRFQMLLIQLRERTRPQEEEQEDKDAEQQEPATVKAASAIAEGAFDHRLTRPEKKYAGPAVHYTFGTLVGGVYGAASEADAAVTAGAGLPFGAALWLTADEIGVPLLGLSEAPWKHPASTHVYALASHLVYGLTAEGVRRLVRRLL